jgi:hypothetical protein
VAAFVGLFLAFHWVGLSHPILTRYWVQVFPFVFLAIAAGLHHLLPRRLLQVFALLLACWFLANRSGAWYVDAGESNFAIAERSMAYRDLLSLQWQGVRMLEEAGRTRPVFYGLPDHYKLEYPEMGYAGERPPLGHCIHTDAPYDRARRQDFQPRFAMLFELPWLGGSEIATVQWQAREAPDRRVSVGIMRSGRFSSTWIEVEPSR